MSTPPEHPHQAHPAAGNDHGGRADDARPAQPVRVPGTESARAADPAGANMHAEPTGGTAPAHSARPGEHVAPAQARDDHPRQPPAAPRIPVRKTYKLYVGGAFPRSESGRSYPVTASGGAHLANAALASRKDARDAVVTARSAFPGWSGRTAYNRGQILYRVAEVIEGRRTQFAAEVAEADGVGPDRADELVSAAIDRWVYYAGWPDKIAQVLGAANPVAGPYFNLSQPEPTGVVAILAPPAGPLLGLVSVLAPVIATGNTAVVVAAERAPLPAVTLAEALATSDVPGGVVNILTGRATEIAPHLAAHADVNGLDLTGAAPETAAELERSAAQTLKRVLRPNDSEDWSATPGTARMTPFLETKTVWHTIGT